MKLKELFTGFGKTAAKQEVHSCCGEHGHSHTHEQAEHAVDSTSGTIYQCPMKCEGEKTYDQPGRCPVCGMFLKPVAKD